MSASERKLKAAPNPETRKVGLNIVAGARGATPWQLLRIAMSTTGGEAGRLPLDDMFEGVEGDLEVLAKAMSGNDDDDLCLFVARIAARVGVLRELYRRESADAG